MTGIKEGQWLKMKGKPNIQVLVCKILGNGVSLCQCGDGYSHYIKTSTLEKHYEPVFKTAGQEK